MRTTRGDLHLIAAHVLGRRRVAVSGHFGLRASPRGLATPAFGPEPEVVRVAGDKVEDDGGELETLYEWFDLGWRVLDAVTAEPGPEPGWSTLQLWPEHFDVGTDLDLGSGKGVNLGLSPGDAFSDEPYAYVGPWAPERPGPSDYWNAPFGAVLPRSRVDSAAGYATFLRRDLGFLGIG